MNAHFLPHVFFLPPLPPPTTCIARFRVYKINYDDDSGDGFSVLFLSIIFFRFIIIIIIIINIVKTVHDNGDDDYKCTREIRDRI